ncbi:BrnT family toxin [Paraglaciecola sp.]|uniref:BrnT family toxin n=1 Tax=Paraglaciecola sp. TaxID=1920173 RepID=UPI0030F44C6D
MEHLNFEWDANKSASNTKKHGVSFDEAKTVFTDEYARLIGDPDNSQDEDRFILLGTSIDSKLLVVCHCIREAESIRIISARKADKQERKIYEGYRYA